MRGGGPIIQEKQRAWASWKYKEYGRFSHDFSANENNEGTRKRTEEPPEHISSFLAAFNVREPSDQSASVHLRVRDSPCSNALFSF